MRNYRNIKKLLLLGAGFVGKSTIFKQNRLIYGNGYNDQEREQFKDHVVCQILEQMKLTGDSLDEIKEDHAEFKTAYIEEEKLMNIDDISAESKSALDRINDDLQYKLVFETAFHA